MTVAQTLAKILAVGLSLSLWISIFQYKIRPREREISRDSSETSEIVLHLKYRNRPECIKQLNQKWVMTTSSQAHPNSSNMKTRILWIQRGMAR